MFVKGNVVLHSGEESFFKIECDHLTDDDIETLALIISERFDFSHVVGVPRGGERLAAALRKYAYCSRNYELPTLIVDDVLTTGRSIETFRKGVQGNSIGVVIFARGVCPEWVRPIFQMWSQTGSDRW